MKHGIILVKKEVGMSSYDVIRILKRTFHTSKIGHAGTLDPFACGLLIVGINEGTKILPYLEKEEKEYIAKLTLGKETDTYDVTGKIIKEVKPHEHTYEDVDNALHSFIGEINQIPPLFSAIKLNGVPLYKYAREDKQIKIPPRKQIINDVRLICYENHEITFYVKCNKGTYIRSLGVDLARKLNEVGHLSNLERIGIGSYKILNVKKAEQITEDSVIPIENALKIKKINYLDKNKIKNGNPIKIDCTDELVLIMSNQKALALYTLNKKDMLYYCERGFHYEDL